MQIERVVLVGAGNVGWHLGQQLYNKGISITQVYSRRLEKAEALAEILNCTYTDNLRRISVQADCLYILAVHDSAIADVAESLKALEAPDRLFVHTSGATPGSVLQPFFSNSGVFYPLQSFSRERELNFEQVPLCIHSSDPLVASTLIKLGNCISNQVALIDDHQRQVLHVAAVFVNNFSNYLFGLGKELVEEENISFDLLRPLIMETAAKVSKNSPYDMQTGPARRHDQQTISNHLKYLEKSPELAQIYQLLSAKIKAKY